ncbi:hypothetical protein SAMN05216603_1299 [Pseudomonas benzenivorans]|nr:hypothetical protein SAMN05216603_1299 [Pseudomonas benzenivorans]
MSLQDQSLLSSVIDRLLLADTSPMLLAAPGQKRTTVCL